MACSKASLDIADNATSDTVITITFLGSDERSG